MLAFWRECLSARALEGSDAMGPGGTNEYLAAMHRRDVLREAQQARLAAEATAAAGGMWSAMLLRVAELLLYAGRRLRAYAAQRAMARAYTAPPCTVAAGGHYHHVHHHAHHHDDTIPQRVVWLDV